MPKPHPPDCFGNAKSWATQNRDACVCKEASRTGHAGLRQNDRIKALDVLFNSLCNSGPVSLLIARHPIGPRILDHQCLHFGSGACFANQISGGLNRACKTSRYKVDAFVANCDQLASILDGAPPTNHHGPCAFDARAIAWCAEHDRRLEGESPFDNLMEVK